MKPPSATPRRTASPPRAPAQADRFRRTRAAHASERAEDYVEGIAQLIDERGEARVGDLAKMMGVSHVTVSRLVTRLDKEGLVQARRYHPITLTRKGRALADRMAQRHRVVLAFLRSLGVPERQAQLDAEGIEHHVSEATIEAMRARCEPAG